MEKDNNGGLRILQCIMTVISVVVLLFTSTQLFVFNPGCLNTNLIEAKLTNEENLELVSIIENETIEVATVGTTEFNRNLKSTSRGDISRQPVEEKKYISIDEITISRDMDLTQRCGVSREDFITLLENLRVDYSGFFGENAGVIYDVCEKYEINEIFFCGLIAAESGWNICSNHRNTNNYISMMAGSGKMMRFDTPAEGLEAAAKLLHNRYLSEDGSYYCGKTLSGVQTRFCPGSSTWVGLVYGCMKYVVA